MSSMQPRPSCMTAKRLVVLDAELQCGSDTDILTTLHSTDAPTIPNAMEQLMHAETTGTPVDTVGGAKGSDPFDTVH